VALKALRGMAREMLRGLGCHEDNTIFHQRIEYPEDIYREGVVEDFDTKPAEGEGGSEDAQGHGQGDVKRFGVP